MEKNNGKDNVFVIKNFKVFLTSSKSSLDQVVPKMYSKGLKKSYVKAIILSLIGNKKLSLSFSKKFWYHDGHIYHSISEFISDDKILDKIVEMKDFYGMLGHQILKFDPLFENIIFLPLIQQKILIEKSIMQFIQNSEYFNTSNIIKDSKITINMIKLYHSQFKSAMLDVLLGRHDILIQLLESISKMSKKRRKLISGKLLDFVILKI